MKSKILLYVSVVALFASSCSSDDAIDVDFCEDTKITISCEKPYVSTLSGLNTILETYTTNAKLIFNKFLEGCYDVSDDKVAEIKSYISFHPSDDGGRSEELNRKLDSLFSIDVIIHELSHGLAGRYAGVNSNSCEIYKESKFFVTNGRDITVTNTKTFRASLLKSVVPIDLQESIYFKEYIDSDAHAASVTGVYALLDEFNAYYQGSLASFELLKAYEVLVETENDSGLYHVYLQNFENGVTSYYDFKYYILLYINYAKNTSRDVYTGIVENEDFWEVFTAVDIMFEGLINRWENAVQTDERLKPHTNYRYIKRYIDRISQELVSLD